MPSPSSASRRPKTSYNPLAFHPTQVTLIASAVYAALFALLLWVHFHIPPAPTTPTPAPGVNLTQAWRDLQFITQAFHPYDSRRNEEVRAYLLKRVREIVQVNKEAGGGEAVVFDDTTSNITYVDDYRQQPWTVYHEGTNILVYIRGARDRSGTWWAEEDGSYGGMTGGVLVNAHYDSVSTAYGATDDGVGVATVLQLISHFTTPGQQPERGVVALLNNGEENGLHGIHAYLRHPVSTFPHTFLNLEGAGAGGRAVLFRSTDAEVTAFYGRSPRPFGNIIANDGFRRGFIRSGTDYSILAGKTLGMRGLDLAFYSPRSRYHTADDAARDTSPASLWHMLSAALATTRGLANDAGVEFDGPTSSTGVFRLRQGHAGVWFDILGRVFAVGTLAPTLFALSVALLVGGPVLLILLQVTLVKAGKFYPFSRKVTRPSPEDYEDDVRLGGWKGFFRIPLAVGAATLATGGLALLVRKFNPYIVYRGAWALWAVLLCGWLFVAWVVLTGADRVRPSALQRLFGVLWIYALSWVALVVATVGERRFGVGSAYVVVVYNATALAALIISYLELFALPSKTKYAELSASHDDDNDAASPTSRRGSRSSRTLLSRHSHDAPENEEPANETTALLPRQTTFTPRFRRPQPSSSSSEEDFPAYSVEQPWSTHIPHQTWTLPFLLLSGPNLLLLIPLLLLLTTSLHQTLADGSPVLPIYLLLTGGTALLLVPLIPYLHRVRYPLPIALLMVGAGCLVWCLLAFPFSREARLKVFFVQRWDGDTGANLVALVGLEGYVQQVISQLPSAEGKDVRCGSEAGELAWAEYPGLVACVWEGLAPRVETDESSSFHAAHDSENTPPPPLSLHLHPLTPTSAHLTLSFPPRSKICRLTFTYPINHLSIANAASDARYPATPASRLTLVVRSFGANVDMNVSWSEEVGGRQGGEVACLWNNDVDVPALEEVKAFAPVWSAVTKKGDGLVEGVQVWGM